MRVSASPQASSALSFQKEAKVSNEELLSRFVKGDERAFTELYDRHKKWVMVWISRRTGDTDLSEDLYQEVFLRIYRHAMRFDGRSKFVTWMCVIAQNLIINANRSMRRSRVYYFSPSFGDLDEKFFLESSIDPTQDPVAEMETAYIYHQIECALQALPPEQRIMFVLRDLEGRNYEEMSRITNTQIGTVKSRLSRARNKIRQAVNRNDF